MDAAPNTFTKVIQCVIFPNWTQDSGRSNWFIFQGLRDGMRHGDGCGSRTEGRPSEQTSSGLRFKQGASSSDTGTDDRRGICWHKSYNKLRTSYRETRILQNESLKRETAETQQGKRCRGTDLSEMDMTNSVSTVT